MQLQASLPFFVYISGTLTNSSIFGHIFLKPDAVYFARLRLSKMTKPLSKKFKIKSRDQCLGTKKSAEQS